METAIIEISARSHGIPRCHKGSPRLFPLNLAGKTRTNWPTVHWNSKVVTRRRRLLCFFFSFFSVFFFFDSSIRRWSESTFHVRRMCVGFVQMKTKLCTWSFSTKPMKDVLSISIGWPCRSYRAITKWKKLLFLKLLGGCFSKCALPTPTLKFTSDASFITLERERGDVCRSINYRRRTHARSRWIVLIFAS